MHSKLEAYIYIAFLNIKSQYIIILEMTAHGNNLFLYWTGVEYSLISLLRKLIIMHSTNGIGYNVKLITPTNINDYILNVPKYFYNMCPAHQADFIRVNVICDYGGIWLDSDTLVLTSLDELFDKIVKKSGFFILENNKILWNGIFGSRANTELMQEWKKTMMEKLNRKNGIIEWSEIGCTMLDNIYKTNQKLYEDYEIIKGLDGLYPVNWDCCVNEFLKKPYENYTNIIRKNQPLIVLVNSVYKHLQNKTEQEILDGKMPLNYFINLSFENSRNSDFNHYLNTITSDKFIYNLNYLNMSIKTELSKHNYEHVLIGNLFYDHEQTNPPFYNSDLLDECNEKRIRFAKASKMKNYMVEIGLNGGHSSFLSLSANDNIKVVANDIAKFYEPCYRCHPEIYVLKAAEILKELFQDRFTFIKGDCLIEIPKFVSLNTDVKIDLVHIDGAKTTYRQDFFNIMPVLEDNAIIIFDDSNIDSVQEDVDFFLKNGFLHRMDAFPKMKNDIKYRNEILQFKKDHLNAKKFENIYHSKIWNDGNPNIPLSGPGSSLQNAKMFINMIDKFIYDYKCKSVLDLGCGDLTWMQKTKLFNDINIKYSGVDIVESLITSHLKCYPDKTFLNKNIVTYNAYDTVDVIIIRDVIFHLMNYEIINIFKNIKHKFKYLVITSCMNKHNTDNFDKYYFAEKNLNIEPFNITTNILCNIFEKEFNRNVFIYEHDTFYNLN